MAEEILLTQEGYDKLEEERDFILKYVSNEKEIFNVKIKLN